MKTRVIAIVLFIIVILMSVYVFFGKNWFAEQHNIQKQKNNEFIKNDLMEKFLDVQAQSQEILNEILQENYEFELFPHQKIEMNLKWSKDFTDEITGIPIFDYKHIYLITGSKITAYKKKIVDSVWVSEFNAEIYSAKLLDANRILINSSNSIYCINRDSGNIIWSKEAQCEKKSSDEHRVFQISLEKYKSLDNSVILMNSHKKLMLLKNINGEEITSYSASSAIRYISDFDIYDRSIYYIDSENKLAKLSIKVKV